IVAARKAGLERGALDERLSRIGEVPFSSERKLMSTVHSDTEQPDRVVLFTKGAPDVLLSRCTREMAGTSPRPLTAERAAAIRHESDEMARDALRTLAVASRSIPR